MFSTHAASLPVYTDKDVILLSTYPTASLGVIQCDLNYSVTLLCITVMAPTPVLRWTFNGEPRGTGERLIIRRLSRGDLGTYGCVVKNNQGQYLSKTVNVSLPKDDMDPTDESISPDPVITVSGGSAIVLLIAGSAGLVAVLVGIGFTITQAQRTSGRRIRRCC